MRAKLGRALNLIGPRFCRCLLKTSREDRKIEVGGDVEFRKRQKGWWSLVCCQVLVGDEVGMR